MKNLLIIFFIFFSSVSFAQSAATEQIKKLNQEMEKSFKENDMLKVVSFYLDSATISAGGRMNVSGRKAIDEYWNSFKGKNAEWRLEVTSVEEFGMYVLQHGKSFLKIKSSDGSVRESNVRFFLVWIKTGDSYKIQSDIYARL